MAWVAHGHRTFSITTPDKFAEALKQDKPRLIALHDHTFLSVSLLRDQITASEQDAWGEDFEAMAEEDLERDREALENLEEGLGLLTGVLLDMYGFGHTTEYQTQLYKLYEKFGKPLLIMVDALPHNSIDGLEDLNS